MPGVRQWGESNVLWRHIESKGGRGRDFIFTVDTSIAGGSGVNFFELPLLAAGHSCTIDWGDGSPTEVQTDDVYRTHNYGAGGIYTITLSNETTPTNAFYGFDFNVGVDNDKLKDILQWGINQWDSMQQAFRGCNAMDNLAEGSPDVSLVTAFNNMFRGCTTMKHPPDTTGWINSSVTTIAHMFRGCDTMLEAPCMLSWDTSGCNSFQSTFLECYIMPTPRGVESLDTSNVTNMSRMFKNTICDPDVSSWDASNLSNGTEMLEASGFTQTNYDKLLNTTTGWPSQTVNSGISISFGTAKYGAGDPAAGRAILVGAPNLWVITDGGAA